MTDEENKSSTSEDVSTEQETETSAAETGDESLKQEAQASQSDEPHIDYKAQADKYKKLYEDRQKALERISKAKEKQKDHTTDEDATHDTSSDVDARIEQQMHSVRMDMAADVIEDVLDQLSNTPDEREAIRVIYENRVKHTGYSRKNILEDIQDAKLIANRGRFEQDIRKKTEADVKKALAEDKHMRGTGAASAGRQPPESREHLSSEEQSFMRSIKEYKELNNLS